MPAVSKFTPEVRETILICIGAGMSRVRACAKAKITRKTLAAWEKKAAEEEGPESAEYEAFVQAMELAEDAAEGDLEAIQMALTTGRELPEIVRLGDTDIGTGEIELKKVNVHALHFRLQSGGSKPWAEAKEISITGKDGGPIEFADKATVRIGTVLEKMAARFMAPAPAPAPELPAPSTPPAKKPSP